MMAGVIECVSLPAAPKHPEPGPGEDVSILLLLQLLTVPYLLMNAIGRPVEPGIAPYATAMSGILFTSGIAYVLALASALREPPT